MFVNRNKIPPTATKERAGKSSMAIAVGNKRKIRINMFFLFHIFVEAERKHSGNSCFFNT